MEEAQAGIKIARRNINNLGYADDTTFMAESEEEVTSLLMKVKEESEKFGSKLNIQKMKIRAGALGRPRGMVQGGRREEGLGWGTNAGTPRCTTAGYTVR